MILLRNARFHAAAPQRRGSALAISLIVVMVIASLGAGLIQMHGAIARKQLQAVDNKRALYIAEAGLSEAFMAISHGKSGQIGSEDEPAIFGNGLFWVEAVELPEETIALVSNGLCETGRFSLAMTVKREVSPIASLGMFGAESVTIGEGAVVDGYDSQAGSFASQVDPDLDHPSTGTGAKITSNAEITVDASGGLRGGVGEVGGIGGLGGVGLGAPATWIYGDAIPGPRAGVLADPAVLITGNTTPAVRPAKIERLPPPDNLKGATALSHADGSQLVLSNVQNQYRKVHVGAGSELHLEGPVTLMTTGLTLEPGATLSVDTTAGPVMLYVTDYASLHEGSNLTNASADPTQVALVIGAKGDDIDIDGDGVDEPSVTLESSGEFYGMVYAPRADLELPASLRMYGCIGGKNVTLQEGAHFSYDHAMTTTGVAITGIPGLLSWRIVEIPDVPIVRRRVDPIRALRLAGVTPVQSSQAHMESFIRLNYTDTGGTPQVYEGLETGLNWNLVRNVDAMRWAGTLGGLGAAPTSTGNGNATPATSF